MSGDAFRVIAIDGPAGAGKSTIARALSRRLGLRYLDTGAMYRAVTWAVIDRAVPMDDAEGIAEVARSIDLDVGLDLVTVDGTDVTRSIRTPEVTAAVSPVSANSAVRVDLVHRQRQWAHDHGGGVLEGRDIGSVVFPDATLKLYLTASPRTRAERRVAESGGDVDEIEAAIAARDAYDSSRADSPLVEPAGSIVVDTTGRTVDEVLDEIAQLLDEADARRTAADGQENRI